MPHSTDNAPFAYTEKCRVQCDDTTVIVLNGAIGVEVGGICVSQPDRQRKVVMLDPTLPATESERLLHEFLTTAQLAAIAAA